MTMTGLGWIGSLIVGGMAGWISDITLKSNMGLLLNVTLGLIGAILMNTLMFAAIGTSFGGIAGQLGMGAIGACVLISLAQILRRWV